ncbi:DUF1906 domain-containing protein [Bradyrhizobium sp.]|jgi:hypothetical protein|uniref:DUF1906 domain-containing protein n=1 Tax=Bradyrhizobium sp. TaxID=376 RepID=UPI002DFFF89B|nr:DUF1906 domain-containing protein [Bradyrhizobium sp.]
MPGFLVPSAVVIEMNFTRRQFTQAALLTLTTPAMAATPLSPAERTTVADASMDCSGALQPLKERGVKVIVRYYALRLQPFLPTKRITKSEADAILENGFQLLIAYQYQNGNIETFSPERARQDCEVCLDQGRNVIGQPRGSTIYFGVDNDFTDPQDIARIVGYFEQINDSFQQAGNFYRVGVYGPGSICSELGRRRLVQNYWIAGFSTGWSGAARFYNSGRWNLFQNALEIPVGSIQADFNVVNASASTIGSFTRAGPGGPIRNGPEAALYRFLNRDEPLLDVNTGQPIEQLRARKMVSLVSVAEGSAIVDAAYQYAGRGEIKRGRCRAASLTKIDRMPG